MPHGFCGVVGSYIFSFSVSLEANVYILSCLLVTLYCGGMHVCNTCVGAMHGVLCIPPLWYLLWSDTISFCF